VAVDLDEMILTLPPLAESPSRTEARQRRAKDVILAFGAVAETQTLAGELKTRPAQFLTIDARSIELTPWGSERS
jgi:hypothetical protein